MLAFEITGGLEAGKKFVEGTELHSHVANIGDVRSLVIHPASTTHRSSLPRSRRRPTVTPGLVRLSVGIESIDDIIADLDTGLRRSVELSRLLPVSPVGQLRWIRAITYVVTKKPTMASTLTTSRIGSTRRHQLGPGATRSRATWRT